MDMMKEFLALGKIREVEGWSHMFMGQFSHRRCRECGLAPAKGLELTRGINQMFFCRICAFTARDAVELFYKRTSWKSTQSTGPK